MPPRIEKQNITAIFDVKQKCDIHVSKTRVLLLLNQALIKLWSLVLWLREDMYIQDGVSSFSIQGSGLCILLRPTEY